MSKLAVLGLVTIATAALAAGADAGPATTDSQGNVSTIDVGIAPPVSGRRPARVTFQEFFGNRNGTKPPRALKTTITLTAGLRSNARLFAKCPLPATSSDVGKKRCKPSARVGGGTVEVDARPAVADPLPGTITAYNGTFRAGKPTLILLADVVVGGSTVTGELDFEFTGSKLTSLDAPQGTTPAPFTVTKVEMTVGRTIRVRRGGRRVRVSLLQTPPRCRGGLWHSSELQ